MISNTTESKIPQLLLRVLGGYLSVAGLFGLITNGASLFVFYRHTRLRSPTNTFIVGLLCTDLAMCLLEIPFVTSILYTGRLLWKFKLCVLRGELSYFCGLSNMYILAAISLNRYLLITKPLRFKSDEIQNSYRYCLINVLLYFRIALEHGTFFGLD
jgi:hypothetical protein